MDPFQGIEVQVISNGQCLKLYDDPDVADTGTERTKQHYIEAVTGATFEVRVTLTSKFKFHNLRPTNAIRVTMSVDGQDENRAKYFIRQDTEPELLRGQRKEETFHGVTHFCPATRRWLYGDYAFARLEIKESTDTTTSTDLLQNLGRIEIRVERIKRERRSAPKHHSARPGLTAFGEVAEKALKGKAIANTVTLTNTRPCHTPTPSEWRSRPCGEVLTYNFLYRSRTALKMMGCIPRSRSPSPAINNPNEHTDPEATQREVQELRARLAVLERGIKPEPRTNVKREREGDEANAGSRQRPRGPVKVETVDLTDD